MTRGLVATFRSACAAAGARRAAFAAQLAAMAINDIGWVAFWALFFGEVGEMRGWDGDSIMVLLAVICASAGITLGVMSNARHLGPMISAGELDEVLRLPTPTLPSILLRRVEPVNVGDLVFGVVLFLAVGNPTPVRLLVFAGCVALSTVVMTSFLVLTGSLAFFSGRGESAEVAFRAVIIFSTYPVDVFAGVAKAVLYTAIPAAFVSTIPAHLLDDFDAATAAVLVAVAAAFATAASLVFHAGLRRYTSGAVWAR